MNRWLDFGPKQIFRRKSISLYLKLLSVCLIVGLSILASGCKSGSSSGVSGSKAPSFTLKDFSGIEYSSEQFEGKVVFIDFWASWCPPCRTAIPRVAALHEEYKDNDEVVIMGINLDQNRKQADDFIAEHSFSYITLVGGLSQVSQEYGVRGIPAFFIIDQEGTIIKQYSGFTPRYESEWREEINKLLN
ncbi:MAG: TlpA disulfide reductase family protein [bacterium]